MSDNPECTFAVVKDFVLFTVVKVAAYKFNQSASPRKFTALKLDLSKKSLGIS